MKKYRVAQVGAGSRGKIHLDGWVKNADRFELVALCDLDAKKLADAATKFGISKTYTDAERMLAETKPDIFCFSTMPDVRLSLVELGVRHGVKAIAMEKPMATSLAEARRIRDLCAERKIKAVVSHQQKYLPAMQKLRRIVASGDIGRIDTTHVTTIGWMSQLATHFIDYTLWVLGWPQPLWAIGHVHGRGKLTDSHPSPDHFLGEVCYADGVRSYFDCGCLGRSYMDNNAPGYMIWIDSRLAVWGTEGYAWADTANRWGAMTKSSGGKVIGEVGRPWVEMEMTELQPIYLRDLADWLDDDRKVHPCHMEVAYQGFEIMEAVCSSALDHVRVDLPLRTEGHEEAIERMRRMLPEVDPLK